MSTWKPAVERNGSELILSAFLPQGVPESEIDETKEWLAEQAAQGYATAEFIEFRVRKIPIAALAVEWVGEET